MMSAMVSTKMLLMRSKGVTLMSFFVIKVSTKDVYMLKPYG